MPRNLHKSASRLTVEEKYQLYEASVQDPAGEMEILSEKFLELTGKAPVSFREDFGGSAALSAEWVRRSAKNVAYAVDIDAAPLYYAKNFHHQSLTSSQQQRLHLVQGDVRTAATAKVDMIAALNFSYFIFKERSELLAYFKNCYAQLKNHGVFFIDLFGGTDSQKVVEEKVNHGKFVYYWDCLEFNPINHHCKFAIHFKKKNHAKLRNVFVYDWRLWSLPELIDILRDAGFTSTHAYWEGDDGKGGGNGEFYISEKEENCLSWVAYVAAVKNTGK